MLITACLFDCKKEAPINQTLDQISVSTLKGVGPKLEEKLAGLGVLSIQDLLFHLPLRYQDRTRITAISALQAGGDAVVEGTVKVADIAFGKRRSLVCRLQDGSGTITLRFFHFTAAQKQQLAPGTRLRCYGEARRGASGLELYHPEYQPIDAGVHIPTEASLTPIYPSSEGLSQGAWRKLSAQALTLITAGTLQELLPPGLLPATLSNGEAHNSSESSLEQTLLYLHRPPAEAPLHLLLQGEHPLQQRLAFEELLAHSLSMLRLRQQSQLLAAPAMTPDRDLAARFLQRLDFSLTKAQQRVGAQIEADMSQTVAMMRLIQGDVGSGKTVVAAIAALQAIGNGFQVAIMAPTEILAEQHFNNFSQWLQPLGIELAWLSGKVKGKQRESQLAGIASGDAAMVVGTHALFQEQVHFGKLGLAIIDEQHRFGVHQRLALREKASPQWGQPHQLIMTATPIPRTLAMSAYADLDHSVIDELPPGRTPINTVVIDNSRRSQVIERVRNACAEGRQAYWVCTLIEESETVNARAAEDTAEALQLALPELRIGLIHGRMKGDEKVVIMQAFSNHQLDLLVATTVIEVGVDVANASLMIIENAERLGLAQLHQLRGRVGRGSAASHCVLMYQSPLGLAGKNRLRTLRASSDGFVIAQKDLELRGPGELLGTRQTGLLQMRVASLERHGHMLEQVQNTAKLLFCDYPHCVEPLIKRWLPLGGQYGQV